MQLRARGRAGSSSFPGPFFPLVRSLPPLPPKYACPGSIGCSTPFYKEGDDQSQPAGALRSGLEHRSEPGQVAFAVRAVSPAVRALCFSDGRTPRRTECAGGGERTDAPRPLQTRPYRPVAPRAAGRPATRSPTFAVPGARRRNRVQYGQDASTPMRQVWWSDL